MTSRWHPDRRQNGTKVAGADQNDEFRPDRRAVDPPRHWILARLVVMMLGRTIVKGTSPRRATRRCSAMLLDNVYVFGCDAYFSKILIASARDTQSSKERSGRRWQWGQRLGDRRTVARIWRTYAVDT